LCFPPHYCIARSDAFWRLATAVISEPRERNDDHDDDATSAPEQQQQQFK